MKNREKYSVTADALKAYDNFLTEKDEYISFADWCERDNYADTSLLDVAKEVRTWMNNDVVLASKDHALLRKLDAVIANEESRPKRNFERFNRLKDASMKFMRLCNDTGCGKCRYGELPCSYSECFEEWLYGVKESLMKSE